MNKLFKITWLLVPVAVLALHYGPGQRLLARDSAGDEVRSAESAAGDEAWIAAAEKFALARETLPEGDDAAKLRLGLEEARAKIRSGEMVGAQEQLEALLAELKAKSLEDTELARAVRHEFASSSYYAGWIMRVEGATPEEWKPETERARQHFRLLAERAGKAGDDEEALSYKKDLEAAIRLEQMDLSELMARPLPKKCSGCCGGLSQRKRKQSQSRCNGEGKSDKDTRKDIKKAQGAGLNKREGTGS